MKKAYEPTGIVEREREDTAMGFDTPLLTFTHNVCALIPVPYAFVALRLTDQFPVTKDCMGFWVALNTVHVVAVRLFRAHAHEVGVPELVSVNCILNGAIPAQLCPVLLVATDTLTLVNDATGAGGVRYLMITIPEPPFLPY